LLLLGYGKAEYSRLVSEEDKSKLFRIYRKRFEKYIKTKEKEEYQAFKIVNELFKNAKNNEIVGYYIQNSMNLKPDSPELPRMFKSLAEIESLKGNDIIVQMIGHPGFKYHLSSYFLKKMVENKYLDLDMEYFIGAESKRKYYTELCKLLIREIGVNPDNEAIECIDDINQGNFSEKKKKLTEITEKIKENKQEFEAIEDRDELVKILAENKEKATLYYLLNGGKTRFALVNNYNSEKFSTILKVANKLEYHEGPLNEFLDSLKKSKIDDKQIKIVKDRLMKGRFPIGETGKFEKLIRVDVSDSANLERITTDLASIFGSKQVGSILKYIYYKNNLKEKNSIFYKKLESVEGLGNLPALINKIEKKYPNLEKDCEKVYTRAWKKLGEKKILDLSIHAVLDNESNPVKIKGIFDGLEIQRKALIHRFRQMYKSKSIEKTVRNERIRLLEEKGRAKLMRFVVAEVAGEKYLDDKSNFLLDEWESHLDSVFNDFEKLQKNTDIGMKAQEKTVNLRWLDKKEDLIECLRFADSAQCCFNSKNYRIEGQNVGSAEWIVRTWKDPLSFIFQIEEKSYKDSGGNEKTNAIGFVFGSFGKGPIVMLNGVYMEGKTDTAAQSIINTIEQEFSKPLNAKKQVVGSRYGGSVRYGKEYSNDKITIKRLRAIKEQYGEEPEDKIYDDLASARGDLNKEYKTIPDNSIIECFYTASSPLLRCDFKNKGAGESSMELDFENIPLRSRGARGVKISDRKIAGFTRLKRDKATTAADNSQTNNGNEGSDYSSEQQATEKTDQKVAGSEDASDTDKNAKAEISNNTPTSESVPPQKNSNAESQKKRKTDKTNSAEENKQKSEQQKKPRTRIDENTPFFLDTS